MVRQLVILVVVACSVVVVFLFAQHHGATNVPESEFGWKLQEAQEYWNPGDGWKWQRIYEADDGTGTWQATNPQSALHGRLQLEGPKDNLSKIHFILGYEDTTPAIELMNEVGAATLEAGRWIEPEYANDMLAWANRCFEVELYHIRQGEYAPSRAMDFGKHHVRWVSGPGNNIIITLASVETDEAELPVGPY